MQIFRTLQQPLLGEKQRAQSRERELMPSIMATSLARWRTHSARTTISHNQVLGSLDSDSNPKLIKRKRNEIFVEYLLKQTNNLHIGIAFQFPENIWPSLVS